METTQKTTEKTATQKNDNAAKNASTPAKSAAFVPLSKENMIKWIAEERGVRFMADASGKTNVEVKAALRANGLQTKAMVTEASRRKVSFREQKMVYDAVEAGVNTEEEIAVMTGIGLDAVMAIVRKFKRDGTMVNALSINAKPTQIVPPVTPIA